ncbi:MAG: PDZ domain-containing protein [Mesorhizobium sp.]
MVSVEPDSAAASSGLVEGDVIATIDRKPIGGPERAARIAADHADLLLLGIYRDDQMHFVVVRRGNS